MGQQEEGMAYAQQALEMAKLLGDTRLEERARRIMAENLSLHGEDLGAAVQFLEQLHHLRTTYTWLALLHASQGRWSEAEQMIERAHPIVDHLASPMLAAFLHQIHGFLAYQQEAYPLAERELQTALSMAEQDRHMGLGMSHSAQYTLSRVSALSSCTEYGTHAALPAHLTEREVAVLKLVAQGKSNRQIAHVLGLSEKTVTNHLTPIFNKTTCDNRAAATAFAIRHGLA